MTNFNNYQNKCVELKKYPDKNDLQALVYCTLAMGGETGELQNKVKKLMRGDKELTPEVRQDLLNELGDVLWYVAMTAYELGCPLEMVANMNLDKLHGRLDRGTLKGDGDNR